jgi:hypothetical protein
VKEEAVFAGGEKQQPEVVVLKDTRKSLLPCPFTAQVKVEPLASNDEPSASSFTSVSNVSFVNNKLLEPTTHRP